MKMLGKVIEYSEKDLMGYIEGLDDIVYIFHQNQVNNNEKLELGDLVEFNFMLRGDKNMPYATDIEKRS